MRAKFRAAFQWMIVAFVFLILWIIVLAALGVLWRMHK